MEVSLPKSSSSKIGDAPTGFFTLAESSMMTEIKRITWSVIRAYLSHIHGVINSRFWLITPMQRDTENIDSRPKTVAKMNNLSTSPRKTNKQHYSGRTGSFSFSLQLASHEALHREEDKRIENELYERYKFPSTTQGQTWSLIWIDYFTVDVINHRYKLRVASKGKRKLSFCSFDLFSIKFSKKKTLDVHGKRSRCEVK